MIGINIDANEVEYVSPSGNVRARYFDGVGLGGDFTSYIWNGALATNAKVECTDVYRYIVKNFAPITQGELQTHSWEHPEVWMFGISRGAYIVRCVAGMINNCGIIRDGNRDDLIDQVYDLYRSPYEVNRPDAVEMIDFRQRASHVLRYPPIKFMGLFDTVGSRGVPKLNYHTGTGFEWPEFYDNKVSSEVEKVYHAVAIHDRLWAFQPCLASRDDRHDQDTNLKIYQKWFPGCHYDLARQEFQFLREGGSRLEKFLFPMLNMVSNTISPNEELSDLVLLWILEGIETEGGGRIIQHDMAGNTRSTITGVMANIKAQLGLNDTNRQGSGDVYGDILSYLPGGKLGSLTVWLKSFYKTAYDILFKPVDRVIPDPGLNNSQQSAIYNSVYHYMQPDLNIGQNVIIQASAGITLERYPSRTYENYITYMNAVGRLPSGMV